MDLSVTSRTGIILQWQVFFLSLIEFRFVFPIPCMQLVARIFCFFYVGSCLVLVLPQAPNQQYSLNMKSGKIWPLCGRLSLFTTALGLFQGDDGKTHVLSPGIHHCCNIHLSPDCSTQSIPEVPGQRLASTRSPLILKPGHCVLIFVRVHVSLQAAS